MIALRGKTLTREPMVLNYSCCIVLGSGQSKFATPETSREIELCYGLLAIGIACLFGACLDIKMSRQFKTKTKQSEIQILIQFLQEPVSLSWKRLTPFGDRLSRMAKFYNNTCARR